MKNYWFYPLAWCLALGLPSMLSAQFFPACAELSDGFDNNTDIHKFCFDQRQSDYYATFSYSNISPSGAVCECREDGREIIVARNSFRSGSNYFRFSPNSGTNSGTYRYGYGPGQSGNFYPRTVYTGRGRFAGLCVTPVTCYEETRNDASGDVGAISTATQEIRSPSNFSASDGTRNDRVILNWTRETDIPSNLHSYRIYRDNSLIATVSGSLSTWPDVSVEPNKTYTYKVTTYANRFSWGEHESSAQQDNGSAYRPFLEASDGSRYNSTQLKWANMANVVDEIRLLRAYGTGANRVEEEISVLGKNTQAYNDQTGIPGFAYTYTLSPIGGTAGPLSDSGYSRPDGTVKGKIKSTQGAGVSGVTVELTLQSSIPAGGQPLLNCGGATYCTTTDTEGNYEFEDVYYHENAEFEIVPNKVDGAVVHEFRPALETRSLSENNKNANGVDFTDLTVFTAAGKVTYPVSPNGVVCGVKGVTILVDSTDFGIKTDANGEWSFAIQDAGTYAFTPNFLHHEFENAAGTAISTFNIQGDQLDIDFEDVETDTLTVTVQGSCQTPLGDYAVVRITSPKNCFFEEYNTNSTGFLELTNLPARDYIVQVVNIVDVAGTNPNRTNILDQIGNIPVKIDLTLRDTGEIITVNETTTIIPEETQTLPNDSIIIVQEADTILAGTSDTTKADIKPELQFIYRSPLDISIDFDAAGATTTMCTNSAGDNIIVMEQGISYNINIDVAESLNLDCPVDTGFLKIYDYVSDRGNQFVRVPIRGGIASYRIDAGEPIIATSTVHNHEKLLYIIPEVDLVEPTPVESWILVTGAKSNTPSFITRTPEIPMLILHDPPGDNSYAYVEKGTSLTTFTTNEVQVGGEAGVYANLLIGAKVLTPFSNQGLGTEIKFSAVGGKDNFNRDGTYTTMTFNETVSTSDADNLTGHGGDVYIGAAYNQEYSESDFLSFDPDNCAAVVEVVPVISDQTFATTFIYTETHIKNTLLPTISRIRTNLLNRRDFSSLNIEEQREIQTLIADSVSWVNILARNDTARGRDAIFEENISFSSGAALSREFTADSVAEVSYEYNAFLNVDFAVGVKIDNEAGAWFDSEIGVMGAFRYSNNVNTGTETDTSRTVGYVLDDNDIGDFFSVDIKKDKSYNVPAFDLKVGTTSCPQEAGSQARDRPTIVITPPEVTNVPADGSANFLCRVSNLSESRETREYGVRVVSTSNPDGALVRLGGQLINNNGANFFLAYGETANLNLSITKGPIASQYKDIAIMVYPPCEYELWQDNGSLVNADTALIKILNFETECTNISLRNPDDGWLLNQASGNRLQTTLSGYDLNNEKFNSVSIEIKKEGEGYAPAFTLDKTELIPFGGNYDVSLDLANYEDGDYRIRATANCGLSGITYSSEKRGIIDRTSLAPFGIPTPNDGFLRAGQEISVTFDKQIDCNFRNGYQPVVSLRRADTGEEIPVTASCSGDRIILNTTPHLTEMPDLQGVEVTATLDSLMDLSGNIQKYTTNWTFLVNVNPIFWDPDPIYASGVEGVAHTITGVLKNNSLVSRAFSLDTLDAPTVIHYPEWLTPLQTSGTILPSDDYTIGFQLDDELTPGIYTDVITALVDDRAVSVPVTFELLAEQINWVFHPGEFQHDMTMVTQFSLDGTDNLLSTDGRDLIAAFVDGEIRGVANIEYVEQSGTYVAFLNIHSNFEAPGNEKITFRFWRALTGVEYGAVETELFRSGVNKGSIAQPIILHPQGIFQVIPLNKGWNWISLNVETDDMSRESVLASLMGRRTETEQGNNLILKSQSQAATYLSGNNWSGNLRNLALDEGYLLYLSDKPDTLKIVGLPSPTNKNIRVTRGWNWIGYPRLDPAPVNDVLGPVRSRNGDIIKGQSDFALYEASTNGWAGSLDQLWPGRGYKLNSGRNGTIIHPPQKSNGYEVARELYEHNMFVTGHFDAAGIGESNHDELRVLAFVGGECRGIGELEYVESQSAYRAFVLVSGNNTDDQLPIEYRIMNEATGKEYATNGEQTIFSADGLRGSLTEPYPFFQTDDPVTGPDGSEFVLGSNQPNPATATTVIPFTLPLDQSVEVEIHDANGRLMTTLNGGDLTAGNHAITVDVSNFPTGIYIYTLRTELFSESRRMMVR